MNEGEKEELKNWRESSIIGIDLILSSRFIHNYMLTLLKSDGDDDDTTSAESKLFKLNPIIYLKLLADHYLFCFDCASLLIKTYVESRLGQKEVTRRKKSCSCENETRRSGKWKWKVPFIFDTRQRKFFSIHFCWLSCDKTMKPSHEWEIFVVLMLWFMQLKKFSTQIAKSINLSRFIVH